MKNGTKKLKNWLSYIPYIDGDIDPKRCKNIYPKISEYCMKKKKLKHKKPDTDKRPELPTEQSKNELKKDKYNQKVDPPQKNSVTVHTYP